MKKDKNSLKQKIVIAIACLVIVACTISMTTMAWFTDTMQGTTNLTFGKIKLSDDYTEYTFAAQDGPAVASRVINDADWTIVLDETSNDAFIRLLLQYGAPVELVETEDDVYLPNKAYYDDNGEKLVAESDYTVGDDMDADVYEYEFSLSYITTSVSTDDNDTLSAIADLMYTTEYFPVEWNGALGTTFVKGVKYYATVDNEFRALIGSTDYDASVDYQYGQSYDDVTYVTPTKSGDPEVTTAISGLYVAYQYSTTATTKTYALSNTGHTGYYELVAGEAIGIADNHTVGTTDNNRYVIYNAYIDWLIENVAIPTTPVALGNYYTEVDTSGEDPVGVELTAGEYAFIRTEDTVQGTAEYYLASDLAGTALAAVRTDEDGVTYNYVFAEENTIKIKDSADQLTLKSATLTQITGVDAAAVEAAVEAATTEVLVKQTIGGVDHYTIYSDDIEDYYTEGEEPSLDTTTYTFYTYVGEVTEINGHVYFLATLAANGNTPLVLKYAQKDLGLVMSIDIQAMQTILSRKTQAAETIGGTPIASGAKVTIAIISEDDATDLGDANAEGELGFFLNGEIVRVATIEDIAPFFDVFN